MFTFHSSPVDAKILATDTDLKQKASLPPSVSCCTTTPATLIHNYDSCPVPYAIILCPFRSNEIGRPSIYLTTRFQLPVSHSVK